MTDTTTKQVIPNPEGKGGFGDNPQNRSDGRWSKENSYTYWINFFKTLSIDEFKAYKGNHPEMTMAALGAYARVGKSIDNLKDFQETADRTEGKAPQTMIVEGGFFSKEKLNVEIVDGNSESETK